MEHGSQPKLHDVCGERPRDSDIDKRIVLDVGFVVGILVVKVISLFVFEEAWAPQNVPATIEAHFSPTRQECRQRNEA